MLGLDQTGADVYPLLDWKLVIRFGGFLWLIGAATAAVVLVSAGPAHVIGNAGWVVVVGILLGLFPPASGS